MTARVGKSTWQAGAGTMPTNATSSEMASSTIFPPVTTEHGTAGIVDDASVEHNAYDVDAVDLQMLRLLAKRVRVCTSEVRPRVL